MIKRPILKIAVVFTILFSLNSCSKDETKPEPKKVEKITYDAQIRSILTTNCSPCHAYGGAQTNFTTYTNAANSINSIIDRTNKEKSQSGFMPDGGTKLSKADLDLLAQWKTDGLLEKE